MQRKFRRTNTDEAQRKRVQDSLPKTLQRQIGAAKAKLEDPWENDKQNKGAAEGHALDAKGRPAA